MLSSDEISIEHQHTSSRSQHTLTRTPEAKLNKPPVQHANRLATHSTTATTRSLTRLLATQTLSQSVGPSVGLSPTRLQSVGSRWFRFTDGDFSTRNSRRMSDQTLRLRARLSSPNIRNQDSDPRIPPPFSLPQDMKGFPRVVLGSAANPSTDHKSLNINES